MHRAEKWIDGWLWVQTRPNGKWYAANDQEAIASLHNRIAALEAAVAELKKGEP